MKERKITLTARNIATEGSCRKHFCFSRKRVGHRKIREKVSHWPGYRCAYGQSSAVNAGHLMAAAAGGVDEDEDEESHWIEGILSCSLTKLLAKVGSQNSSRKS